MATFFVLDTHLGHANIIRYCKRPFADVLAMDEALIANWNAVVRPDGNFRPVGLAEIERRLRTSPLVPAIDTEEE